MNVNTALETERILKVLANANRLRLLTLLKEPKGYSDIALPPSRSDAWGQSERAITREAVRGHLHELMAVGLVKQTRRGNVTRFVANHGRLFVVAEHLRSLAHVQPEQGVPSQTLVLGVQQARPPPEGPSLVLVRGVREGEAFPLSPKADTWLVGRAANADVRLDYDPFVSARQARLLRKRNEFYLQDLPGNRNGTLLNWSRLAPGALAPLRAGDVIGAGLSLLVVRV